jgi:L-ascorbate metabolism protein UlaG (beta-lactamase superfamily)
VRVTWIGHSTVVVDVDGVRLLTDPLLHQHSWPLRRLVPRPDPESWRGPDAVLISHLHHDHAELRSLRMLRGVPLMSDPENVRWLRKRGLGPAVPLGDEWVELTQGVSVRQVRAVHDHRPMPHRPNAANGHIVKGPSGTVWIAGDTELYPEMDQLPQLAGGAIDVALVPVWGWGPRLSGGHLSPLQAAEAVRMTQARYALPVHWGTLHPPWLHRFGRDWLDLPGEHFADAVASRCPDTAAVVLEPGQSWSLPR